MVTYLLENIDEELWMSFKSTLKRHETINDAIVKLIKKHVADEVLRKGHPLPWEKG